MAMYLDPKIDLTFKRVFGEHKNLYISLINSMLSLDKPIVKIEYQTGELIPILARELCNTVIDVRCTDSADRQFLVVIQLHWDESFKSRVLLNASKAYMTQFCINTETGWKRDDRQACPCGQYFRSGAGVCRFLNLDMNCIPKYVWQTRWALSRLSVVMPR